ncbi:aminotransferase class I/II-fold pyridoxal phosphate-dependent enzyme [Saliphagus infecundisoli]|uniref:Aminotransferase n=1 Tax=Saliphagus infecundisoli TaxID=1849069 RepID=A0ABD5QFC8_9EURY|nr:aminotransferase class I/II-fold pyridoxal phosphate-dependent enzyme [Saliphagus infecundisoli]
MSFEPAGRVREVPPSGIRRFFEIAEERDDVISLGVGEPDFATPWAAREAAIDSLERGRTSYTANRGMADLRAAISGYVADRFDLSYDASEEILVTAGASEAVDLAFRAFVDPGDRVAVAQPSYISYEPGITFAGGDVLPVATREADEFRLTREALAEAGAEEAEALVYCYPNNPTGAVMSREQLEPIADFAREHDLLVFADEIYAELTYDGEHASIATLPGMRERTVVFNGFSKAHAMTGLRLGYALAPAEAIGTMNRIHQYTMLSAPTTAQYAAIEAIESCAGDVREMVEQYDRRRRFVLARFEEIGMPCFEARGAFYVFPQVPEGWDADTFAEELLTEHGVAVVPGSVFGSGGDGHLRVSYATGMEELREALARIERFVDGR